MEANSESRAFEQERMQHSDVEASVQDTVEPVRKMSQMRQLVMEQASRPHSFLRRLRTAPGCGFCRR